MILFLWFWSASSCFSFVIMIPISRNHHHQSKERILTFSCVIFTSALSNDVQSPFCPSVSINQIHFSLSFNSPSLVWVAASPVKGSYQTAQVAWLFSTAAYWHPLTTTNCLSPLDSKKRCFCCENLHLRALRKLWVILPHSPTASQHLLGWSGYKPTVIFAQYLEGKWFLLCCSTLVMPWPIDALLTWQLCHTVIIMILSNSVFFTADKHIWKLVVSAIVCIQWSVAPFKPPLLSLWYDELSESACNHP